MTKKKLKKEKPAPPTLVSIKIRCGETEVEIPTASAEFSGRESECESCGSHGSVTVHFTCPACEGYHKIELESW